MYYIAFLRIVRFVIKNYHKTIGNKKKNEQKIRDWSTCVMLCEIIQTCNKNKFFVGWPWSVTLPRRTWSWHGPCSKLPYIYTFLNFEFFLFVCYFASYAGLTGLIISILHYVKCIYFQRAFRYLQQAADAGNSNAMAYLGKVCLSQK